MLAVRSVPAVRGRLHAEPDSAGSLGVIAVLKTLGVRREECLWVGGDRSCRDKAATSTLRCSASAGEPTAGRDSASPSAPGRVAALTEATTQS